ncbi:MAG: hypothetical protein CME88_02530 [Hirschia sp.]|nr:hypothetical protein [Hirschia sp.]MBF17239.1 hypothetical protein [Hirschia sp.]
MARKREKSKAFWRWSIVAMLGAVFGLFAVVALNMPPATDPQTACRTDHRDPAHTVLLIDQSDPFSTNDFGWVEAFIDQEARQLPKYGRLTVMTPNVKNPYDPQQVFSQCSTGSADAANPFFENPRMVEDNWRMQFRDPLNAAVRTVLEDQVAPSSPLAEAIHSIFDRADFSPPGDKRRVVIISDLIQNSENFNFYRMGADFETFSTSRLAQDVRDTGGAQVVARIVPRQSYDLPMSDVKAFWSSYFSTANADFSSVN